MAPNEVFDSQRQALATMTSEVELQEQIEEEKEVAPPLPAQWLNEGEIRYRGVVKTATGLLYRPCEITVRKTSTNVVLRLHSESTTVGDKTMGDIQRWVPIACAYAIARSRYEMRVVMVGGVGRTLRLTSKLDFEALMAVLPQAGPSVASAGVNPNRYLAGLKREENDGPSFLSSCSAEGLSRPAAFFTRPCPLRSYMLLPQGAPVGVTIFFHGVKQHSQGPELLELAKGLTAATKTAWYALDQQGHGRSGKLGDDTHPRRPCVMLTTKSVREDAMEFIRLVLQDDLLEPNLPFVISGHAMGGGLCLSIVPRLQDEYGDRFRGFVLSAPSIAPMTPAGTLALDPRQLPAIPRKARLLARIKPDFMPKVALSSVRKARSSSFLLSPMGAAPRYTKTGLPVATLIALRGLMKYTTDMKQMERITRAFLISQSFDDNSTHAGGAKMVHAAAKTSEAYKFLDLYQGAQHNLLADLQSDPHMFKSWCDFIEGALTGAFLD